MVTHAVATLALFCAAGGLAETPAPGASTPKTIAVLLRANWRTTPLLLEASEFFATEDSPAAFWRFAEHGAIAAAMALPSDEAQHAAVERAALDLLAPLDQRLLETYLATAALSPRVEAQLSDERSRAAELGVPPHAVWWALACGRAYMPGGAETLDQFLVNLRCAAEPVDEDSAHVYTSAGAAARAEPPLVTLFATLGTEPFAQAHAALRAAADGDRIAYAHVHRAAPGSRPDADGGATGGEGAVLSGYGVSLAIKNMEYKVIDDTGAEGAFGIDAEAIASLGGDADADADDEVGGFLFSTLGARRPELVDGLGALRAQLQREAAADGLRAGGDGDGSELKVWALADLGYQAAYRVATAANPLSALRDISSNLPAVASTLARVRVDPKFKHEIAQNAGALWSPGQSLVTINGRSLPLVGADNNYFPALDLVRDEVRLASTLVARGAPPAAVPRLLAATHDGGAGGGGGAAGGSGAAATAVCIEPLPAEGAPAAAVWLSNVEKDAPFRQLPRSFAHLLRPSWPGQVAFIRRNIYSAIIVADPTTEDGARALHTAVALVQQGAPLRVGLVVARAERDADDAADASTTHAEAKLAPSLRAHLASGWAQSAAAAELAAAGVTLPHAGGDDGAARSTAGAAGARALRGASAQVALYARALAVASQLGGSTAASTFVLAVHELRERAGDADGMDPFAQMFGGGGGGIDGLDAIELAPITRDIVGEALVHALSRTKHAAQADELVSAICVGLALPDSDDGTGEAGGRVQLLDDAAHADDAEQAVSLSDVQLDAALDALPSIESAAASDAIRNAHTAAADFVASRSLGASLPLLLLNGAVHQLGDQAADDESMGALDRVLMMGALSSAESAVRALVRSGDLTDAPKAQPQQQPADGTVNAPAYDPDAVLRTIARKASCLDQYHPRIVGAGAAAAKFVALDDEALTRRRTYLAPPQHAGARAAGDGDAGSATASCAAPPLAHWVAVDLGTAAGVRLAAAALERVEAAAALGAPGAPPACVRASVVHRVDPRAPTSADGASAAVATRALTLALASAWEAVLQAHVEADASDASADGAFARTLDALRGVLLIGAAAAARAGADASERSIGAIGALRAQLGEGGRARELFDSAQHTLRVQALIAADGLWCARVLDTGARGASGGDGGADVGASASARALADGYVVTNGRVLDDSAAAGRIDAGALAMLEASEWRAGGEAVGAALAPAASATAAPSVAERREAADRLLRVGSWLRQHARADGVERVRALEEGAACALACVQLGATRVGGAHAHGESDVDAGLAAALHMVALVDPLSRAAQRLAPVLAQLRASLGLRVTLILNPSPSQTDLPLKDFYRYTAPHALAFDERGRRAPPSARFGSLSTPHTLTLHLDTAAGWLTEPSACAHDMDNFRLADVPNAAPTVLAEYRLAALLISGSCHDLSRQVPPNGLQLVLSAPAAGVPPGGAAGATHVLADTLVMQNLGYFQLQAFPGPFAVRLASGSLSEEVYEILELPRAARTPEPGRRGRRGGALVLREADLEQLTPVAQQRLAVRSFEGATTTLLVRKRAGKENVQLLEADGEQQQAAAGGGGARRRGARGGGAARGAGAREAEAAGGGGGGGGGSSGSLWNAASSLWATAKPRAPDDETVHIFSLASGQLYERFLRIMMLSVVEKSSRKVKFWLIRNFASAGFKAAVPHLAAAKGFEVEFVRYQWPPWLRAQSEKQRIIWGYKILFLDVLFPLSLKKVIYIDADQVVRSDIAELWDLDLKGRAVGMTPFCSHDANPHTTGFRFWAQGYWVDHLRSRPYHISALFVVDLQAFRARAAGDRYRVFYDSLSADPNSLSNLDQDLPNYAQHSVPIASLPEHWLWCETWCGNASKAEARTIDLCNNPLTKEPKIEMAKRIIGQRWIDLDNEARAIEAAFAANASAASARGGGGARAERDEL